MAIESERSLARWIHPILSISLVPLHLFVANWGELDWQEVWPVLLLFAVIATVGQGLLLLVSAPPWARLGLSSGWLAFFLYAPAHRFLGLRHIFLAAILLPVTLLMLWMLTKARPSTVEMLEGSFTLGLSTVVLINLGILSSQLFSAPAVNPAAPPSTDHEVSESSYRPDVYLIVFDAFAGGEALDRTFGYDNAEFQRDMATRGFEYYARSRALYDFTICSIPSVLSARRLCHEVLGTDWNSSYSYLKKRSVGDSLPLQMLRQAGYDFVSIASDEIVSFKSIGADRRQLAGRAYLNLLFSQTPFAFLKSARIALASTNAVGQDWNPVAITWVLDQVEAEAQIQALSAGESPKFVFAHIMLPHMPFYFDADGNVDRRFLEEPWKIDHQPMAELKRAYLDQVAFLEGRMIRLADRIGPRSDGVSPIVLFQGDHGPRWPERGETEYTGYEARSGAWAVSQFSALNMVRAPLTVTSRLEPTSSPSNSFIAVMNSIVSSKFEEMPDVSYAVIDENRGGDVCLGDVARTFAEQTGPLREVCR